MMEAENPEGRALQKHLETARFFLEGGQWQRCADAARQALSLDPNQAECHMLLAVSLGRLGDLFMARQEADAALALDSSEEYFFYASALIAIEQNDLQRAYQDICHGLDVGPERAYLHYGMYLVYRAQSRWEEALPFIRYALYLEPENPNYHLELAIVYLSRQQWEESDAQLQETLRLDPENASAQKLLGICQLANRNKEASIATLRSALALDPEDTLIQRTLLFVEKPLLRMAVDLDDEEKVNSEWQTCGFLALVSAIWAIGRSMYHPPTTLLARWPYLIYCLLGAVTIALYASEELFVKHARHSTPMWGRRLGMLLMLAALLFFHWMYWTL